MEVSGAISVNSNFLHHKTANSKYDFHDSALLKNCLLHEAYKGIDVPVGVLHGWINLRQNKHVLWASRDKGAPQKKNDHKAINLFH